MFSPEEYTHFKPGMALFLLGCFAASVGALYVAVSFVYPDRPSVPREFPGGLEEELGGKYAMRVSNISFQRRGSLTNWLDRRAKRVIRLTDILLPSQLCTYIIISIGNREGISFTSPFYVVTDTMMQTKTSQGIMLKAHENKRALVCYYLLGIFDVILPPPASRLCFTMSSAAAEAANLSF